MLVSEERSDCWDTADDVDDDKSEGIVEETDDTIENNDPIIGYE
jgi:hypothetical protein